MLFGIPLPLTIIQILAVDLGTDMLPAWHFPLFGNRLLLAGVVAEILLMRAIVHTPPGNALFGTAPLAGEVWLLGGLLALGLAAGEEIRKFVTRR